MDATNFRAAAHVADKYDMPVLGKQVATYLNTVNVLPGNVAQYFIWADRFEAATCKRNSWMMIRHMLLSHVRNRYGFWLDFDVIFLMI